MKATLRARVSAGERKDRLNIYVLCNCGSSFNHSGKLHILMSAGPCAAELCIEVSSDVHMPTGPYTCLTMS